MTKPKLDPEQRKAVENVLLRALADPEIQDDVMCTVMAMCRLDQGERHALVRLAHDLLDARIQRRDNTETDAEVMRQHMERERLRQSASSTPGRETRDDGQLLEDDGDEPRVVYVRQDDGTTAEMIVDRDGNALECNWIGKPGPERDES